VLLTYATWRPPCCQMYHLSHASEVMDVATSRVTPNGEVLVVMKVCSVLVASAIMEERRGTYSALRLIQNHHHHHHHAVVGVMESATEQRQVTGCPACRT
jgi:hypothetical protein